tara:strand:- start:952 stop:1146 length:195 start_codon:yes stop_codon:yes gene_type:complete
MYLNIINNINRESNKKSKKIDDILEQDKDKVENNSAQFTNYNDNFFYYSIFYGDLTKNWIKLRH